MATLRNNVVVGVQYLEAWLGGLGCVPLYNLMEDAATAEICRTQVRAQAAQSNIGLLSAGSRVDVQHVLYVKMFPVYATPRVFC